MIGTLLLFFFSAVPQLLFFGGVAGSDVNWGKKVSCFVVDGTIVCPGCNYRAGLSCPRKLKDSQNCLLPPSTPPLPKTKPTPPPETTYGEEEEEITNTTGSKVLLHPNSTTPMESNEIQKEPTKSPVDMSIYLYRILSSKLPQYHRLRRDISQQEEEEEEPEVCNWNGDCPCPLICCKTGPGCPKRCVMGIRLPPPWG